MPSAYDGGSILKIGHNMVAMVAEHVSALTNFYVNNTTVCVNLHKMATYLNKQRFTYVKCKQKYWQSQKACCRDNR
jgi:hypothetical protein